MPNPQKVALAEEIAKNLDAIGSLVLSDFTGINVEEISELRKRCRESGVTFRVVKNTLAGHAVKGTDMEELTKHFEGPTALAFSEDLVAPARVLQGFSKEFGKLEIKAGFVDGRVIDQDAVKALADLPGREQLLSMLLTGVQAPLSGLARALNATIMGLVTVLDQLEKKKTEAA